MKLLIEVYLPDTPAAARLARSLRAERGIYSAKELDDAHAREVLRNARAAYTGRPTRKRIFVQPDAEPNRRLMCDTAAEFYQLAKALKRHMVAGAQHEIGKNQGGD